MNWLVTGGAGFIGANLVVELLHRGESVSVVDDLSRAGSEINAAYLSEVHGVQVHRIDISDGSRLRNHFMRFGPFRAIAHTAGQVSLMSSLEDPMRDFLTNAFGTLNVLECVRETCPEAVLIGMSSNKIYGDLASVHISEEAKRYVAPEFPVGFSESLPLDFHGPYGCSKGVTDQYLLDYYRSFGIKTFSLRQSSVYGPMQHPRSDQGWVGYLMAEACAGREILLNGRGKQVRDLLHVSDLVELMIRLGHLPDDSEFGVALNVGGGVENSLSILELFEWFTAETGAKVQFLPGAERPSDQKVFVADHSSATRLTDWRPSVGLDAGLRSVLKDTPA